MPNIAGWRYAFSLKYIAAPLFVSLVTGAIFIYPSGASAQPVTANWCTHTSAQRLNVDVNGDGVVDAICHDTRSGAKWVAVNSNGVLTQVWDRQSPGWCNHAGATLHAGDVNGDRRADLVCKDRGRVWVDFQGSDYFKGTDYHLDTNWCTHTGSSFTVRDENGDGRADLVCMTAGTTDIFVDLADADGQFGGTDFHGTCTAESLRAPFETSTRRPRGSADPSGNLRVRLAVAAAGDINEEVYVEKRGFNPVSAMGASVIAHPTLVTGGLSVAGPPLGAYGQTGASIRLEIIKQTLVGRELRNEVLCSDTFLLNEVEAPGFNAHVPLNRPRTLRCAAEVQGGFLTRVTLRGWASAALTQTNMDAHLSVPAFSVRTCRPSS